MKTNKRLTLSWTKFTNTYNEEQREELPFDDAVLVNKHIGNYYTTY